MAKDYLLVVDAFAWYVLIVSFGVGWPLIPCVAEGEGVDVLGVVIFVGEGVEKCACACDELDADVGFGDGSDGGGAAQGEWGGYELHGVALPE